MEQRPPLKLPANDANVRRLVFGETRDGFELSDRTRGRRLAACCAHGLFALSIAATVGFVYVIILGPIGSSPRGPVPLQRNPTDVAGVVVIGLLCGLVPLGLWWYVVSRFGLHRGFVVRVHELDRSYLCLSLILGLTWRRREVDFRHAEWDIQSGIVTSISTRENALMAILLVFSGPLGWLLALAQGLSRTRRDRTVETQTEVIRLTLIDAGGPQAVVTCKEKSALEFFLAAWDRAQR